MSIDVRCRCGYSMELPDEWSGKQGRCPQCRAVLQIPKAEQRSEPTDRPSPARPSAAGPVPRSGPEPAVSQPAVSEAAVTEPEPSDAVVSRPWTWLILGTFGVLFVAGGIFLLVSGPNVPKGQGREARTIESEEADVFRPVAPVEQPLTTAPPAAVEKTSAEPQIAVDQASPRPALPPRENSNPELLDAWTMRDYGVELPAGSSIIEIDGVEMELRDLSSLASGVVIALPLGKHVVRFSRNDAPRIVEPRRWFWDAYREAQEQVQENGRWSFDKLLEHSRRTLDRFTEPLVPHFWGNFYLQEREFEAAARHYAWAAQIAPTFAPAYLNLAYVAHERDDDAAAARFLRLADLWNIQNAYGLARASASLRQELEVDGSVGQEDEPDWLAADHSNLSARDRDMIAVLRSAAEFTPRLTERAKILNNLGAYFEHERKSELALENYRFAAASLRGGKPNRDEAQIIQRILENLARVCRDAGMPESKRYERLQAMVQP